MFEKEIIDVTGIPLTPSPNGKDCLGNGEHTEYECCCDECDYFLHCFPEYDYIKNKEMEGRHFVRKLSPFGFCSQPE